MTKTRHPRSLAACVAGRPAHAQTLPFDMSPERPALDSPAVTTPDDQGKNPLGSQPVTVAPVTEPAETEPLLRYILPEGSLARLGILKTGCGLFILLSAGGHGTKLNLGYQNSIFVAPETSRLTVELNNTKIAEEAIRSPESISDLSIDLPKDPLKPGSNLIRLRSNQRHRTDCSIQSTYELWSNIDTERTYLSFAGNDPLTMQSLMTSRPSASMRAVSPGLILLSRRWNSLARLLPSCASRRVWRFWPTCRTSHSRSRRTR